MVRNSPESVFQKILMDLGCTSTATLTIRVNSFSGSHTLTDSQTICLGDNAIQINPTNTPTPTILSAVATYQWQRRFWFFNMV